MTTADRSLRSSAGLPSAPEKGTRRMFWLDPGLVLIVPYVVWMVVFGLGPGVSALLFSFAEFEKGKPKLFQAGDDTRT